MRLSPRGAEVVRAVLSEGVAPDLDRAGQELLDRLLQAGLIVAPPRPPVGVGDVTVVVPALSAPAPVERLLASLPEAISVILVDDGSPVPLGDSISRPGLKVVRHDSPKGPAAARNAGAAEVLTTWVLFVDADLEPPADWVAALRAYAQEKDVVAVAPRVISRPAAGAAGWFERACPSLDLGPDPADVGLGRPVPYVPSAALLVRQSSFQACGGFDPRMHVGEDVDLVWRLVHHGRVRYEPDVCVNHAPRPSLSAALNRRRQYGTSAAPLSLRHPGTVRHVEVSWWSFAPWALAVAVRPWLGAAVGAATLWLSPRAATALPPRHARQLAAKGHHRAFVGLGRWLSRPLLPVTVALAVASPTLRPRLAAAVAIGLADVARQGWRREGADPRTRTTEPLGAVAATVLDDAAYSLGVWQGAVRHRTLGPLLPRISPLREKRGQREDLSSRRDEG
jgi:mycofactocin system glycosyltransferase